MTYIDDDMSVQNGKSYSIISRGQPVLVPDDRLVEPLKFILGRLSGSRGLPFTIPENNQDFLNACGFALSLGLLRHVTPTDEAIAKASNFEDYST